MCPVDVALFGGMGMHLADMTLFNVWTTRCPRIRHWRLGVPDLVSWLVWKECRSCLGLLGGWNRERDMIILTEMRLLRYLQPIDNTVDSLSELIYGHRIYLSHSLVDLLEGIVP